MSIIEDRRQGEGCPHPEKEKGRTGKDRAAQNSNIDHSDSTAQRALYLPLTWAELVKRGHHASTDAGMAGGPVK